MAAVSPAHRQSQDQKVTSPSKDQPSMQSPLPVRPSDLGAERPVPSSRAEGEGDVAGGAAPIVSQTANVLAEALNSKQHEELAVDPRASHICPSTTFFRPKTANE